jgi:Asp-tRNA(Asn)/Glu-tRNA(Gln) amidotransferase A subunit family amidase
VHAVDPLIHAVIALDPTALDQARAIDRGRKARGLLYGYAIGAGAGCLAAVAGYPHLTVPMGAVMGLPVGLSIIGPAWSEARLLGYGYAYEQAAKAKITPRFLPSIEAVAPVAPLLQPLQR